MPKSDLHLDSGEYAPVADRIRLFYAAHPTGRIVTKLIERGPDVVFQALVYRSVDEARPAATGWASERVGDGDVNAVACLENTETSAIGRALANLGFTASAKRPSAEEMAKASRERARLAVDRQTVPPVRALRVAEPSVRLPDPAREALITDVLDLLEQAERAGFGYDRAWRLRERLSSGRTTPAGLERVERGLRRWLADQRPVA